MTKELRDGWDEGKVNVYYNLHKKIWSVKATTGPNKGKVIRHSDQVYLTQCEFRVGQKGNEKVRAQQSKNVHAYVSGYLAVPPADLGLNATKFAEVVTYNPYKHKTFVNRETLEPVSTSDSTFLTLDRKVWAWNTK